MIGALELSPAEADACLGELLRCPPDTSALAGAMVGEHIRTTLFGSLPAGKSQTVHTIRLLSSARRLLHLGWMQPERSVSAVDTNVKKEDFCLDILRRMSELGDVWHSGSGRWLPTPLRLVGTDGPGRTLVLGSAPLAIAERFLKSRVTCAGPSRFLELGDFREEGLCQSIDAWLGSSPTLEQWACDFLARVEPRMEDVGGLVVDQLEIYAPDVLRDQRRRGRWIAAAEVGRELPDTRLCRPKLAYARAYDRPYYLAHFQYRDGRLSLQRQATVEARASLRLRYGLDIRLGTGRQLAITQSEHVFVVERPLLLPEPEQRVLALGWPELDIGTQSTRLTFHNDALPFVLHALRRLSINPVYTRRPVP